MLNQNIQNTNNRNASTNKGNLMLLYPGIAFLGLVSFLGCGQFTCLTCISHNRPSDLDQSREQAAQFRRYYPHWVPQPSPCSPIELTTAGEYHSDKRCSGQSALLLCCFWMRWNKADGSA
jgi:hypothetical protein